MRETTRHNTVTASMTRAEIYTMAKEVSESGLIVLFAVSVLIGLWSSACLISAISQNGFIQTAQALFTAGYGS